MVIDKQDFCEIWNDDTSNLVKLRVIQSNPSWQWSWGCYNIDVPQSHEFSFVHHLTYKRLLILQFCIEHGSDTAMLGCKFWATEIRVTNQWVFARFEFQMLFGANFGNWSNSMFINWVRNLRLIDIIVALFFIGMIKSGHTFGHVTEAELSWQWQHYTRVLFY